jgi:acyl carrier protein phosphodiesterase
LNWLAHVFLSGENIDQRLGNLLADAVKGAQRAATRPEFQRGAALHRAIDAYTDAHPLVRRSRSRISAPHRRFSGVLVDVFYDFLLASDWRLYSNVTLDEFTREFYAQAKIARLTLPEAGRTVLDRIIQYDLLGAYRSVAGVEQSLRRLSLRLQQRWRRNFALETAVADLRAQEGELRSDFREFFPDLQAHLAAARSER